MDLQEQLRVYNGIAQYARQIAILTQQLIWLEETNPEEKEVYVEQINSMIQSYKDHIKALNYSLQETHESEEIVSAILEETSLNTNEKLED